ncbi:hypothetical protein Vretifemale_6756 [Volvox reticuliferus]|uniref:Uncharacterized protein n=1 Tax=Volvox reticuliferus TaxID=1737510 RepID=A0A8J4FJY0_9CHLO|nr:hypothetical protein Vretifemale_6756 [Volvox reticuliferus]
MLSTSCRPWLCLLRTQSAYVMGRTFLCPSRHAGAAVGPASDSEAAGGTISALQATVDQILSCVQQLHGLVLAGQPAASIIEVAASNCKSGPRDQIENLVGQFWTYTIGTHAPCCCAIVPWAPQVEFKWGRHGEDDEQTVKKATKFLRSIAPGGCCITPHIRPLILRRTRLSASCSIISERTNRGSGSLRCKELQRIFQDRRR